MVQKVRAFLTSPRAVGAGLGVASVVLPACSFAQGAPTGPGGVDYGALSTSFTTAIQPVITSGMTPGIAIMALFMAPMVIRRVIKGFAHG